MNSGPEEVQPPVAYLGEYLNGLYSYALILSGDRSDAEDLVQQTCLRAVQAASRLRNGCNVKSWLFAILRNLWANQLRTKRIAPEIIEFNLDKDRDSGTANDPHTTLVNNDEGERIRVAIQQLPVDLREIVVLRELEDLSYKQLAELLETPMGTVMARLARARQKLRSLLPAETPV
jgi:RNA polymerase sigma-70 factor (ECF subfamily)